MYTNTVEEILQQCLAVVRSAEDVEDDEYLDGAIRRSWLSQFEFVKVFSMSPSPPFLSWLDLWQRLPMLDKGEYSISRALWGLFWAGAGEEAWCWLV